MQQLAFQALVRAKSKVFGTTCRVAWSMAILSAAAFPPAAAAAGEAVHMLVILDYNWTIQAPS